MPPLNNKFPSKMFYLIFFISGACSLVYELIWIKMFIPIFGIGLYSISAVVSSFMGGLALGSYICGKVIDHKKNILLYYGFFEFFIGAYAVVLPLLININHTTTPFFYNNISSNFYIFSIFRFILAFFLLIIPCSLMGATLPLMCRFFIVSYNRNIHKDFGLLYALNTFGAVCGCAIVTFFMLEHLGTIISSYVVAAINMLIGIFIYFYSSNHRFGLSGPQAESPCIPKNKTLLKPPFYFNNLLFLAFLCGFCALSFELLLVRSLGVFLPNDVYLFPVVLAIMLAANSLGSLFNSAWIAKFKKYALALCISMVTSGFILAITLRYLVFQAGEWDYLNSNLWAFCLITVFPANFFIGIAIPNLVALYSSGRESVGNDVGCVYSMNTFGAVLGSFLTAFIFIPFFGLRNTFFLCLVIYIVSGELTFILNIRKSRIIDILMLGVTVSSVLLLTQLMPVDLFKDIFNGRFRNKGELVLYKDGIISSIGVFKGRGYFDIRYSDGSAIGAEVSQTGKWRTNHRLKAHIPMILHKDPRRVINIGFGTGISAYSLTQHNNIDKIDNIEICQEILEATKFFVNDPEAIFNNPKASLVVDDGRNFLFVSKRKYDVILVYPFNPLEGENMYFYTKDFLQLCKSRLNPGGLISIWFPFGFGGKNESIFILKAFLQVFPDAQLFSTSPKSADYVWPFSYVGRFGFLIGSVSENGIDSSAGYLEERFRSLGPKVKMELALSNINNSGDILNYLAARRDALAGLCSPAKEIITDEKTIMDYHAARKRWFK